MKFKESERRSKSSKEVEEFKRDQNVRRVQNEFKRGSKWFKMFEKCENVKMHIGREMSIIRGMHRRSRHVKKSKHAQLHAQSIAMCINVLKLKANGTIIIILIHTVNQGVHLQPSPGS
jgi:hypothetical protein